LFVLLHALEDSTTCEEDNHYELITPPNTPEDNWAVPRPPIPKNSSHSNQSHTTVNWIGSGGQRSPQNRNLPEPPPGERKGSIVTNSVQVLSETLSGMSFHFVMKLSLTLIE